MIPTPVVLVCPFCFLHFLLPLPQNVWIDHQLAPTKNKISDSPFSSLPLLTTPKTKTQDKRQATNNWWMLPVGYLTNLWYFQLSNHHESHVGRSLKTKTKPILIYLIFDCL